MKVRGRPHCRRSSHDLLHFPRELRRRGCDFETQIRFLSQEFVRCFDQDRKDFAHFTRTASWKQSDQIWIAFDLDLSTGRTSGLMRAQPFDHWMADEDGAQSRLVVELRLERENEDHKMDPPRHFFYPP